MKLLSLFDGSGGFPIAASMVGIEPVMAAEIEPYPIAVTKSRFPGMKHLGNVAEVKGNEIQPVDIITFGSPCQDLSVAGKRKGLKHTENGDDETTRSGLFMEAIRIIKEMREATDGIYPRYAIWENVHGAFNSNHGEDFRTVLQEFITICEKNAIMPQVPKAGWAYADCYSGDGWSLAYRTFDAQYWGVPQRRRRIYLVADFRGQRAKEILFKREGLRGYFEKGRTPWQTAAGDVENCTETDDRDGKVKCLTPWDCQSKRIFSITGNAPSLQAGSGGGTQCPSIFCAVDKKDECLVFEPGIASREGGHIYQDVAGTLRATPGDNRLSVVQKIVLDDQGGQQINIRNDGKSPTLRAEMHGNIPCVLDSNSMDLGIADIGKAVAYSFDSLASNSMKSKNPNSGCRKVDISKTLDASVPDPSKNQGGIAIIEYYASINQISENELKAFIKEQHLFENHSADTRYTGPLKISPTLPARLGTGGNNTPFIVEKAYTMKIRSGCEGGGKGPLVQVEKSATLGTFNDQYLFQPVVFDGSNITSPINKTNPQPGDPCHTLNTDSRNYVVFVVGNGQADNARLNKISGTLNCMHDQQAVLIIDRAYFKQGEKSTYIPQINEEICPTLIAQGPHAVNIRYIVRRLTPTECARLQGFPDMWGHPDIKESLTDEEYKFWSRVRKTYAKISGKKVKEFSKEKTLRWYNKLHSDSAEYKMWGNGIALPNALYIMQGIVGGNEI